MGEWNSHQMVPRPEAQLFGLRPATLVDHLCCFAVSSARRYAMKTPIVKSALRADATDAERLRLGGSYTSDDRYFGMLRIVAAIALTIIGGSQSVAQPSTFISDIEISKESDNPVTRWVTLPLRYEGEFLDGPYKDTKDTFELDQAVLPFRLDEDWSLITRTKFPFIVQPPKKTGEHWESGLSNGYTTFFLSPEHGQGFYWGAGPVLYYPSATNAAVGVNKWGSGPSVAFVVKNDGPWVFGAVANNIWTFGGPSPSGDRTNQLLLNPIVSYHLGDGWAIGSSPNITANWITNGGKWTVPVGGGVSKVIRIGNQPLKLAVDAYYNAIRPKAGFDTWTLQFTLTLLFVD
jgi:hypothetical protein